MMKLYDTFKGPSIIVQRGVESVTSLDVEKTNCLVLLMYLMQHHMETTQNPKKRKIQNERQIVSRTHNPFATEFISEFKYST